MDNNIDVNSLLEKAHKMIKNNQIPAELQTVINQVSSGHVSRNTNSSSDNVSRNTNSSSDNGRSNSSFSSDEFSQSLDVSKLAKIASTINNSTQDDDVSNLLRALKPYLRDYKKEKVDEYIKLIKLGKAAQLFDIFGGDNK